MCQKKQNLEILALLLCVMYLFVFIHVECIDQLTVMFPDMTRAALERTLHFWNNDMQRTVTAILSAEEGIVMYRFVLLLGTSVMIFDIK